MVDNKNIYPGAALSRRQSQCLYYLLRGKSAAAIAKMLGLSPKTVEYYIEEIKNKMACRSKSEIIEESIERGYADIVPPGILSRANSVSVHHKALFSLKF